MGNTFSLVKGECYAVEGGRSNAGTCTIHRGLSEWFLLDHGARQSIRCEPTNTAPRHDVAGSNGLVDYSRAPLHSPHRTSDDLAARIVAFRKRFPFMGPRKIIARLTELHPVVDWPAPSTAGDILARADLVHPFGGEDLKVLSMSPV